MFLVLNCITVLQQLVCEHEIRNIHCACQDAEDLRHFAYITKEHQTHNHYCHVFSSHSVVCFNIFYYLLKKIHHFLIIKTGMALRLK